MATVNDCDVKLIKVQGEFVWHQLQDTDELFLVIDGQLHIQLHNHHDVLLRPGERLVVPRGVRHCLPPTRRPGCCFLSCGTWSTPAMPTGSARRRAGSPDARTPAPRAGRRAAVSPGEKDLMKAPERQTPGRWRRSGPGRSPSSSPTGSTDQQGRCRLMRSRITWGRPGQPDSPQPWPRGGTLTTFEGRRHGPRHHHDTNLGEEAVSDRCRPRSRSRGW